MKTTLKLLYAAIVAFMLTSFTGLPFAYSALIVAGASLLCSAGYKYGYLLETIVPDFTKELATLKEKLTESLTKAQKEEIAAQIKELEAKLAKGEDVKALQDEIKGLKESFVKYDEKDKATQKSLDEMSAKIKLAAEQNAAKENSFETVLRKAVEENTDNLGKFAKEAKKDSTLSFDLKTVGDMSIGNVTGTTIWGAVNRGGIIENPKRKVHIRQVLPGGPIGPGTDYYFMRENGVGEGDPAFTAESTSNSTGAKPQLDFDLIESSVKIETLAGWVNISKKALNNVPGMLSFLQSRLPERLLRVEDSRLLYGTGVTPIIKGILASGNFTASTSSADTLAEAIIDDLALLEDTYERTADFILFRPIDYFSFFKNKASGSGEYDLPMNCQIVNGVLYISGVPAFATTALTTGDYVVGDRSGADFLIQDNMKIEFSYENSDNFIRNKVTVRIEENVALPVYGSTYFIKGAVPSASS